MPQYQVSRLDGSTPILAKHYTSADFADVQETLIEVYKEVYARRLSDPLFSLLSFSERLGAHSYPKSWEVVIGYDNDEAIGYAYGSALSAGSGWWSSVDQPLDPAFTQETGNRTLALFELMIRSPWRGRGLARWVHDELLEARHEERVSLGVECDHPKVVSLYESWGYRSVGREQPLPDAPFYYLMWRPIRMEHEHGGDPHV